MNQPPQCHLICYWPILLDVDWGNKLVLANIDVGADGNVGVGGAGASAQQQANNNLPADRIPNQFHCALLLVGPVQAAIAEYR